MKVSRTSIKDSTILVIGGAGFIGSHLVDDLLDLKPKSIIILDNLFLGDESNIQGAINKGAIFYKDDAEKLSFLNWIFERHSIDIVFNCATKALNYSFINPSEAFLTNVIVISNLLELLREKKYKTLIHFSTSEVYGTAEYEPMDESHPMRPTTTYAGGKAAADIMLESYVKMFSLDAFIVRPFNNYGPRQNFKGPLAGIIPITLNKIFNHSKPEIHGTGNQTRDFIYVKDTTRAILNLYESFPAGECVNIATQGQIKINELIGILTKITNYKGEIIKRDSRNSDVMSHNASNKKMLSFIDFKPISFEKGLIITRDWYFQRFEDLKEYDKVN